MFFKLANFLIIVSLKNKFFLFWKLYVPLQFYIYSQLRLQDQLPLIRFNTFLYENFYIK